MGALRTTKTPRPTTEQLKALARDLRPSGQLYKCIQAGFLKGEINGAQATGLQQMLESLVEHCQDQQSDILRLMAEQEQRKQTNLFN